MKSNQTVCQVIDAITVYLGSDWPYRKGQRVRICEVLRFDVPQEEICPFTVPRRIAKDEFTLACMGGVQEGDRLAVYFLDGSDHSVSFAKYQVRSEDVALFAGRLGEASVAREISMDIPLRISTQLVTDTLISGIEGGIAYWCSDVESRSADRLRIAFRERDGGARFELKREDWPRIVALMATKASRHFANMVREVGDAETGDVLIQLACFGELRYG